MAKLEDFLKNKKKLIIGIFIAYFVISILFLVGIIPNKWFEWISYTTTTFSLLLSINIIGIDKS